METALSLTWNQFQSHFGTPNGVDAPHLLIAGALVVPNGEIEIKASFTLVGPEMDPFNPTATNLPSNTIPGLLASGDKIDVKDYDADWADAGDYEPELRDLVVIRGAVYAASYDSGSGISTSTNQHWHSYDPKNTTSIIGAQLGGQLHNCNSFQFSSDPLVKNLEGFTTPGSGIQGQIYVVEWKEL